MLKSTCGAGPLRHPKKKEAVKQNQASITTLIINVSEVNIDRLKEELMQDILEQIQTQVVDKYETWFMKSSYSFSNEIMATPFLLDFKMPT